MNLEILGTQDTSYQQLQKEVKENKHIEAMHISQIYKKFEEYDKIIVSLTVQVKSLNTIINKLRDVLSYEYDESTDAESNDCNQRDGVIKS